MTFNEKLMHMQMELKVPKGRYSSFGKYNYRSAEDIMSAVKPLCEKYRVLLVIRDEIVMIGERIYVKATVELNDLDDSAGFAVTGYARETLERPKYDSSQLTGAASSYARKYALAGMFLLDDSEDADSMPPVPDTTPTAVAEEKPAARTPRRRRKEPLEEHINVPEGVDEEVPYLETLTEDTYFYIKKDDNYVMKKAGETAPEGGEIITKETYDKGCVEIAKKPKRRTRKER